MTFKPGDRVIIEAYIHAWDATTIRKTFEGHVIQRRSDGTYLVSFEGDQYMVGAHQITVELPQERLI